MKFNKKGFTLIELLAVIVILSIIMLIATPIIMGVIKDAREKAAYNSAMGFINALEQHIVIEQLNAEAAGGVNTSCGTTITQKPASMKLRGNAPTNFSITIDAGCEITTGWVYFENVGTFSVGANGVMDSTPTTTTLVAG